jgi:NAD(P)-dependent dehydrogenase (short-subunit alcohol dehydrogenase family)
LSKEVHMGIDHIQDRVFSHCLEGQVALVTGAGRGLGRGCALALAAAGADLILLGRHTETLEEVAHEVERLGKRALPIVCDITQSAQVTQAFHILDQLDIVVNNAGTNIPEPFAEVTEEHLDRMLALNVKGTFLVSQQAVQRMAGRRGTIIHISSQMGHVGAARRTVYCATKHAIEGLTRAMAVELASSGIRVNAIAPTFLETPMTGPFFEDELFRADVISRIPLGRLGTVEDVTGLVVFLASPAATFITGASFLIDGGWTAQ